MRRVVCSGVPLASARRIPGLVCPSSASPAAPPAARRFLSGSAGGDGSRKGGLGSPWGRRVLSPEAAAAAAAAKKKQAEERAAQQAAQKAEGDALMARARAALATSVDEAKRLRHRAALEYKYGSIDATDALASFDALLAGDLQPPSPQGEGEATGIGAEAPAGELSGAHMAVIDAGTDKGAAGEAGESKARAQRSEEGARESRDSRSPLAEGADQAPSAPEPPAAEGGNTRQAASQRLEDGDGKPALQRGTEAGKKAKTGKAGKAQGASAGKSSRKPVPADHASAAQVAAGAAAGSGGKSGGGLEGLELAGAEMKREPKAIEAMTVAEMKAELKARSLRVSGNKAQLRQRLQASSASPSPAPHAPAAPSWSEPVAADADAGGASARAHMASGAAAAVGSVERGAGTPEVASPPSPRKATKTQAGAGAATVAEAVGAGGDAGGGEAGGETSGGGNGLAARGKLKAKTARGKKMQSAEMDAQASAKDKQELEAFVAANPLPEWVSPTWINGINKSESPAKAKPAKGRRKRASPETRDS